MKTFVSFCFTLIISFNFFGQIDSGRFVGMIEMELYPISVTFNEGVSWRQAFYGTLPSIGKSKLDFNFGLDGVVFRKLDARNNSFKNKVEFPKLSNIQFQLNYYFLNRIGAKSGANQYRLAGLLGYSLFQYGTSSEDFWIRDSIPDKGFERINGIKHENLMFGMNYQFNRSRKVDDSNHDLISRHNLQIAYLLNFSSTLSINYELKSTNINSPYKNQFSGVSVNYSYIQWFAKKIGFVVGAEVIFSPSIKYESNPKFYVPRGSENVSPLFFTVRLGIHLKE